MWIRCILCIMQSNYFAALHRVWGLLTMYAIAIEVVTTLR